MLRKAAMLTIALTLTLIIANTASAQDDSFGKWIELFNGKDLKGWQNAKPTEGHHAGPNRWRVEDGTLTNTEKDEGVNRNDICTVQQFDDFELEIEYKIRKKGNSGVYLRGQIEVQIFDSFGKKKLTSADAGAIYGGNFVALRNPQKAPGEWNKFRVLHLGSRITVWHNDVLVQDNIFQDQQTGGTMSTYPKGKKLETSRGPLMLQGDHEKVWYRNIRIRPLFKNGWKALWNGKDLSEFTARGDRRAKEGLLWQVDEKENAFTNSKTGGAGHDLWTKDSYGNFLLYYSYKCGKGDSNSGFYLRNQWELQILGKQRTDESHHDASLYSIQPPSVMARNGPYEWNHMFVKLVGQKISVWQNGKQIHKDFVCKRRTDANRPTPDFSRAPFKLQGDHGKVWFTGLRIMELPDDAK